jgi:hypothetical protein
MSLIQTPLDAFSKLEYAIEQVSMLDRNKGESCLQMSMKKITTHHDQHLVAEYAKYKAEAADMRAKYVISLLIIHRFQIRNG